MSRMTEGRCLFVSQAEDGMRDVAVTGVQTCALPISDEIGVLARELDRMVARVAESRTQLVDQSFQAGFAELAKGVLHNLGNAMTPIGVRLASLRERLRAAPGEDAEQAGAEVHARAAG